MLFLIFISTILGVIGGVLLEPYFENELSDPSFTAITLYITATFLIGGEWYTGAAPGNKIMQDMTLWDPCSLGLLRQHHFGGVGGSLNRESAARFSFLMATPIILGVGVKQLLDVLMGEQVELDGGVLAVGFISSVVVGYAAIAFLLNFVRRQKLYVFAAYCILFAPLSLVGIGIRDGF